ncbi:MAG TPA: divalent metal cation transporter, partial [Lactobacillus sp.]|nr:divalent metal cation transporter [Lactobacillus sp.]
LMMTDSELEMGKRFKNTLVVKVLGWFSVIALTALNMKGLPDNIEGFLPANASPAAFAMADNVAYFLIVCVMLMLVWMIYDLHQGNKRLRTKLGLAG